MNSTCFDDALVRKLSKQAEALKGGAYVITVSKPLESDAFRVLFHRRHSMSWGPATVYIQRRERCVCVCVCVCHCLSVIVCLSFYLSVCLSACVSPHVLRRLTPHPRLVLCPAARTTGRGCPFPTTPSWMWWWT